MPSSESPTVTLVTEGFNLAEGQSQASFVRALGAVEQIARHRASVKVVVLDPTPENICAPIVRQNYPNITALHVPGQSYDGQKNTITRLADSEYVVFLDGDCKPARDDWLTQILAPLIADARISAVGGLTVYEDLSITGKAMSIIDFGYLYASPGSALGCYASNNVAFRREAVLHIPIPENEAMRCNCYQHVQLFLRANNPVRFQPSAVVMHELPDVDKERFRRGYDHVAALWADPALPETSELDASEEFASRLLQHNLNLALSRLAIAPPELGLSRDDKPKIAAEIKRLLAIDSAGIRQALENGQASGANRRAREIHFSQRLNSSQRAVANNQ